MKLSSFIKEMSFKDMQHLNKENEETDLYDILKSKRHDINVDFGPRTYSMLQQQMMLGNEGYVRDWMEKNSFIEQQDDWPPKDKALDEQIRKVIKKEIAKLHETDYADRLANSGTDSKGLEYLVFITLQAALIPLTSVTLLPASSSFSLSFFIATTILDA